MFPFDTPRTSDEAYEACKLLVELHESGTGLLESIKALEPLASVIWNYWVQWSGAGGYWGDFPISTLTHDPSVTVSLEEINEEDRCECMELYIHRAGQFKISLWTFGRPTGGLIRFADAPPSIAFEAADAQELSRFLVLARLHGGEVDCQLDPGF